MTSADLSRFRADLSPFVLRLRPGVYWQAESGTETADPRAAYAYTFREASALLCNLSRLEAFAPLADALAEADAVKPA